MEITRGVMEPAKAQGSPITGSLLIRRHIRRIPRSDRAGDLLSNFVENGDEDGVEAVTELRTEKLRGCVSRDWQLSMDVDWDEAGITVSAQPKYLREVADRTCGVLAKAILATAAARPPPADPLLVEVREHLAAAHSRASSFIGREKDLKALAVYLAVRQPKPFVLHAEPGAGKSSLLAKAAFDAAAVHPTALVLFRAVGVTVESTTPLGVLASLCAQLAYLQGTPDPLQLPSSLPKVVCAVFFANPTLTRAS